MYDIVLDYRNPRGLPLGVLSSELEALRAISRRKIESSSSSSSLLYRATSPTLHLLVVSPGNLLFGKRTGPSREAIG